VGLPFLTTHWYYNTETGQLTQGNNLDNLGNNLVGGAGWHELDIPGSDTAATATAEAKKAFPKGKAPTTAGITPARVAGVAATEAGGSATSLLGIAENAYKVLDSKGTYLRIAKVVVGSVMIIVGLMKLTGTDKAVTTAAKGAVL
jgi:hypothetical protein